MNSQDTELKNQLEEQFKQLPKVVQDAILSADVEKNLRKLADTEQLHLDQWQVLENEVMLTLLGIQQIETLESNIKREVGVSVEMAHTLAEKISALVFEPIRQEIERQLEHPEAHEAQVSGVEATRTQILEKETAPATPAPTPPTPVPEAKITHGPSSGAYKPGEASTERKTVVDDPYREAPL